MFTVYQFIVGKVEANLQDAAQAGCQCDPQVDLVGFVVRDVFSFLSPDKSDKEHMSGVDLAHCIENPYRIDDKFVFESFCTCVP